MPYSLHLVPTKNTTEVLMTLGQPDGLGQPMTQRAWPNCIRLIQEVGPLLPESARQEAKASLLAGRAFLLPEIYLSDAEIDKLGF